MADNIVDQQVETTQPDAGQAELHRQMQMSLGIAPVEQVQQQQEGSTGNVSADGAAAPNNSTANATPADPFSLFKEKFGYETPEAAVTEIESLRALRDNPVKPEYKFENEESEKLFKAFQSGKKSEVYAFLEQDQRIDKYLTTDVSKENAAEIVKMGMQLRYKDLSSDEINYLFNKEFAIPAKPVQQSDEMAEEYQTRLSDWESVVQDKQMGLMIEAKKSRPEIANAKTKLVLPEIAAQVEPEYLEWKKSVEENQRLSAATTDAYKVFTPKQFEIKIPFKDEQNKIDFEFQHEPDSKSFTQAVELVSDIDKFWKHFTDQAGNPDRQKFLRFIYNGLNHDSHVHNAMNQAKNATIKASLPDNSQGGMVRQMAQTQEPSELDKKMRESLRGYGGF